MLEIQAFDFPGRKLRFQAPAASAIDGWTCFVEVLSHH